VAFDEKSLGELINFYLDDPYADQENRSRFIRQECTYTDGSAGSRTAEFILSILENRCCPN